MLVETFRNVENATSRTDEDEVFRISIEEFSDHFVAKMIAEHKLHNSEMRESQQLEGHSWLEKTSNSFIDVKAQERNSTDNLESKIEIGIGMMNDRGAANFPAA